MVRPPHQFSSAGGEGRFHGTWCSVAGIRVSSIVLGPGERRRGVSRGVRGNNWGDRGLVIEARYSVGLLSAGGRLPQAEKSRDSNARLPPPQVYDSAERDRDNDDSVPNYW